MNNPQPMCQEIQLDPRPGNWDEAHRRHAGLCPGCRAFLATLGAMGHCLRQQHSARETMPAPMRQRLLADLEASCVPAAAPAVAPRKMPWLVPVAMAASLVMGVLLEKQFEFGASPLADQVAEVPASFGAYLDDVTHDHYLLERIGRPLEVEMATSAALSDWLSRSLAFEFHLPAESGGLQLEGGRVWHTVGRLSAMAAYRAPDGTRLVLFAVPAENLEPRGAEAREICGRQVFCGTSWGHEGRAWIEGNLAMALTAPEGHLPVDWEQVFLAER